MELKTKEDYLDFVKTIALSFAEAALVGSIVIPVAASVLIDSKTDSKNGFENDKGIHESCSVIPQGENIQRNKPSKLMQQISPILK